jgi:predicted RNA binding protein YcfA (HicA-like mRNA interferase family)
VPTFGPIKRKELIRYLRKFGYKGPFAGGKHQYMVKGQVKLAIPNPHQSEIGRDLLARILPQAGIERDVWKKL